MYLLRAGLSRPFAWAPICAIPSPYPIFRFVSCRRADMATAELDRPADSLDAFRNETRAWLAAHFPPSLKGKENPMATVEGPTTPSADEAAWIKAFGEK